MKENLNGKEGDIVKKNPVYKREMTVSSRSIRVPVILMLFNGILALVACLNMYSVISQVKVTAEIQYSSFLELYVFVASIEFILLLGLMPALTAGSISGERERQTLDLMLSTQTGALEIVMGKLMSSLTHAAVLVISSFPVMALAFVYGGITIRDLALLMVLYIAVALLSSSIGVCFSAVCKKTTAATAISYGVLLFLLGGTYVINWFVLSIARTGAASYVNQVGGMSSQVNSGGFFYLLLFNPAVAFYQIINRQAGNGEAAANVIQWFGNRSSSVLQNAWIPISIVLQVLIAVFLLAVTVRAVDPGSRRRKRERKKKI